VRTTTGECERAALDHYVARSDNVDPVVRGGGDDRHVPKEAVHNQHTVRTRAQCTHMPAKRLRRSRK
jgi:hypothetical protein